jgi:hypothetical protein
MPILKKGGEPAANSQQRSFVELIGLFYKVLR